VPIGEPWYLEELLGLEALVGRGVPTRIGSAVSMVAALVQEPGDCAALRPPPYSTELTVAEIHPLQQPMQKTAAFGSQRPQPLFLAQTCTRIPFLKATSPFSGLTPMAFWAGLRTTAPRGPCPPCPSLTALR
jgi:hypothetical protein